MFFNFVEEKEIFMNTSISEKPNKKGRVILLSLLLLFFVPMIFATYYFYTQDSRQFKLMHHGDLIRPAKSIATLSLEDPALHQAFTGKALQGKWWVIYVSPDKCLEECHDNLYNIKQMITALSKDQSRVNSLFISLPDCQVQACESYVLEHYPQMKQGQISSEAFHQHFLNITDPLERQRVGEVYLCDPRGFIMMRYSGEASYQYILKDLRRLLKTSQIG